MVLQLTKRFAKSIANVGMHVLTDVLVRLLTITVSSLVVWGLPSFQGSPHMQLQAMESWAGPGNKPSIKSKQWKQWGLMMFCFSKYLLGTMNMNIHILLCAWGELWKVFEWRFIAGFTLHLHGFNNFICTKPGRICTEQSSLGVFNKCYCS